VAPQQGTGPGARYCIGIDLGTTHSALSFIDIGASDGEVTVHRVLPVPQLSAPGTVEEQPLLPSFLYLPHADEFPPGELTLPWQNESSGVVGELARSRGATTPIRLVSSAKSWLSHPGVDRRGAILPQDAPPELERISPLDASRRYLEHLRAAWDQAHPEAPFAEQDVTVTIPASFDPAARELTLEAARAAGYPAPTLLEEPQAALYSWIQSARGAWRQQARPGDVILVVDVAAAPATSPSSRCSSATAAWNCTGSLSGSTSCSAATTWTWRSRTWSRASSPPPARHSMHGSCVP
jgi:molecular chaperone DnaK (HSP70)